MSSPAQNARAQSQLLLAGAACVLTDASVSFSLPTSTSRKRTPPAPVTQCLPPRPARGQRAVLPRPCDLSSPPQQRLGQRIRELRIDAEWTQAELGRRTNIQREIIARIERGMHFTSLDVLTRIARALGLDVETVCVVLDDAWCASAAKVLPLSAAARCGAAERSHEPAGSGGSD